MGGVRLNREEKDCGPFARAYRLPLTAVPADVLLGIARPRGGLLDERRRWEKSTSNKLTKIKKWQRRRLSRMSITSSSTTATETVLLITN